MVDKIVATFDTRSLHQLDVSSTLCRMISTRSGETTRLTEMIEWLTLKVIRTLEEVFSKILRILQE
jgi:hypothetical protein